MKFYPQGLAFSWDLLLAKKAKKPARSISVLKCYIFKTLRSLQEFQSTLHFHSLTSSLIKLTADFNFYGIASRNVMPKLLPAELPAEPPNQLRVRVCLYIQKGVMLLAKVWTRERAVDEILSARRSCIQTFMNVRHWRAACQHWQWSLTSLDLQGVNHCLWQ